MIVTSLAGKVAVVTGAGQGIGRGTSLALADAGASVVLVGRTADKLEQVGAEIAGRGGRARACVVDVSDQQQVTTGIGAAIDDLGGLDIIVNNAQVVGGPVGVQSIDSTAIDICWESGVVGTLNLMQFGWPYLRERGGGSIVNFGSNTAIEGTPGFGAYAMAKEAIRGLSRVAAREWGRFNIRVNVVCPHAHSPTADAWAERKPEAAARLAASAALRRVGEPEQDVGRGIVALVGDDFRFVTGATLMIDGGLTFLH